MEGMTPGHLVEVWAASPRHLEPRGLPYGTTPSDRSPSSLPCCHARGHNLPAHQQDHHCQPDGAHHHRHQAAPASPGPQPAPSTQHHRHHHSRPSPASGTLTETPCKHSPPNGHLLHRPKGQLCQGDAWGLATPPGPLAVPPALLDPLPFSKHLAPPCLQPVSGPLPLLVGLSRPVLANATQVSPPPRRLPMAGSGPAPGPCSLRASLCLGFAHPVSPLSWGRLPPGQGLAEGGACRLVMPGSNGRAAGWTHTTGGCCGPELPRFLLCLGPARLRSGPPHPAGRKEPISVLPNL